jgi:hypothetical protein
MNGIQPKDMPSASSLINMTRNLGGSIGIALLATALTNREHFHSQRLGGDQRVLERHAAAPRPADVLVHGQGLRRRHGRQPWPCRRSTASCAARPM